MRSLAALIINSNKISKPPTIRKGTRLRTKVMRWKSMKISSFTFACVLLHIANCQSTIDQSYIPYLGIIHKGK